MRKTVTDTKNPAPNHTTLHDVIGLALIVASALLGVSAYMFIKNGAPENPWAFTAMMSALVTTFGPPAILWMCFGCGYIGARLFLFGSERSPVRDPLGFTFTALGLAILAGALRPNAGGSFGVMIAGA